MPEDIDIANSAIIRTADLVIRSINRAARLLPNAPGQVQQGQVPALTKADIDRLTEK